MSVTFQGVAIKGILFDYGQTLANFEFPEQALIAAYTELADRFHPRLSTLDPATWLKQVHNRVQREVEVHVRSGSLEEMDIAASERRAYAEAGVSLSDAELEAISGKIQQAWWAGVLVGPDVITVLKELRALGLKLGLCSNASYNGAAMRAQFANFGLTDYLDAITISSEVGWRKPSEKIFQAALESLGTRPNESLMVGDKSREDIAGAQLLGLKTVRTKEYIDDGNSTISADSVIDRLIDLVPLLDAERC